jgi:hypothetical protein
MSAGHGDLPKPPSWRCSSGLMNSTIGFREHATNQHSRDLLLPGIPGALPSTKVSGDSDEVDRGSGLMVISVPGLL